MMSLVAYGASSDEESDCESNEAEEQVTTIASKSGKIVQASTAMNGHISDDDDDYAPVEAKLEDMTTEGHSGFTLSLPKPKNAEGATRDDEVDDDIAPEFRKLPMPKSVQDEVAVVMEEDDDEFLRKKATPLPSTEKKPLPKGPVKITIPSLKDFTDVDKEMTGKMKNNPINSQQLKSSGLLSLLPQAKSEQNFAKVNQSEDKSTNAQQANQPKITSATNAATRNIHPVSTKSVAFIPDTVKHRRPAHNTEGVDGVKITASTSKTKRTENAIKGTKTKLVDCSESEESDGNLDDAGDDGGDFFSLNADANEQLPEVSSNEINVLVAKKAAQIANATTKYLNTAAKKAEEDTSITNVAANEEELRLAQKRYHTQQQQRLEAEAVQALVGGNAKRRKQAEQIQVMDISSDQVLPNRDEWMRSALAGATGYQPTGVLVDEEPAAGTRRKHQITYLAHKAKTNEAELQALWAANRQTRRATQSKYGF